MPGCPSPGERLLELGGLATRGAGAWLSARRHNLLVVNGWLVLRFAWERVMQQPEYVRHVLDAASVLGARPMHRGLLDPGAPRL